MMLLVSRPEDRPPIEKRLVIGASPSLVRRRGLAGLSSPLPLRVLLVLAQELVDVDDFFGRDLPDDFVGVAVDDPGLDSAVVRHSKAEVGVDQRGAEVNGGGNGGIVLAGRWRRRGLAVDLRGSLQPLPGELERGRLIARRSGRKRRDVHSSAPRTSGAGRGGQPLTAR